MAGDEQERAADPHHQLGDDVDVHVARDVAGLLLAAELAPHVISPGASPALGGVKTRSARRPPEFVNAASTPGYFVPHRVRDEVPHLRLEEPRRGPE